MLKVSPDDGSRKRSMPRDVGNEQIGSEQPDGGGAAEPGDPDEPHAGNKEQRAPNQRDQHGLAEIGLQHETGDGDHKQGERDGIGRHFRAARRLAEQPGDQDHERGLEEFRRLYVDPEQHNPTPCALYLGAEMQRGGDQQHAEHKDHERQPADMAGRQE
jgi:hypothetical protein